MLSQRRTRLAVLYLPTHLTTNLPEATKGILLKTKPNDDPPNINFLGLHVWLTMRGFNVAEHCSQALMKNLRLFENMTF